MQIDWFTFGAQIVNFLILVWLLRRFLYGPITSAMGEREQRIADRFEEARQTQEEAEAEAAAYRRKQDELEATREEKLAEAEADARERRREMIEEARAEVDRLDEQWRDALRRERETFLRDLARRASGEVLALARRTLRDLADADLERRLVRVFADRLRTLDADRRRALTDAIQSASDATVHTAFELDAGDRRRLTDALRAAADAEVKPTFTRDAELDLGIEVRAGGHKIAWSLDSYLTQLTDRVRARLDAEIGADASSPAPPSPTEREDQLAFSPASSDDS